MIRWLLHVLLFSGAFVSWLVSQQQFDLPSVEYGGINASEASVRLYEKADSNSRVLAHLAPGSFATYLFSGETGKWHYLQYDDRELAVYGKRITLDYVRIAERWVFSVDQVQNFSIGSGVLAMLLLFVLGFGRRKPANQSVLTPSKVYSEEEVKRALKQKEQQMLAKHQQEISKRTLVNQQPKPQQNVKQVINKALSQQKLQMQAEHERELLQINLQAKQTLENEFKRLKKELEIEVNKKYQPTLEGMKESYRALEAMHRKLQVLSKQDVANARVFDVDLRHVNLESILKGRRFEQCIATCMQDVMGYTIESWTPDKGFLSGIYVKANKDPDLLLISPSGKRIAIECKYRSDFYRSGGRESITWAQVLRADEYKKYGDEKGVTVFLALGVGGCAESPKHVYLVPISTLMNEEFSSEQLIHKKKHFATPKSKLDRWLVDVTSGQGINERLGV